MKNLLPHSAYFDPEFYHLENKLLDKCWFFAGIKGQINNHQDYLTAQHFNLPIFIVNSENSLKGFVNRCLHRGAPIMKLGSQGNGPIKCQYHGWQYQADGKIKAIPFASSFPETPTHGLEVINVDNCGELIFYSFKQNKMSLKDYLGAFYDELMLISSYMQNVHHKEKYTIQANWKINVENSLESYHVAHVHKDTFVGVMNLNPQNGSENQTNLHSSWQTDLEDKTATKMKRMEKIFGHKDFPIKGYKHFFIFPNLAIATTTGLSFGIQTYNPLSPSSTEFEHLVIAPKNENAAIVSQFLDSVTQFNSTVFKEDCEICEQLQINIPHQKNDFYFSNIFEKRLEHFQNQIKEQISWK